MDDNGLKPEELSGHYVFSIDGLLDQQWLLLRLAPRTYISVWRRKELYPDISTLEIIEPKPLMPSCFDQCNILGTTDNYHYQSANSVSGLYEFTIDGQTGPATANLQVNAGTFYVQIRDATWYLYRMLKSWK
jgi:hypothetical protein